MVPRFRSARFAPALLAAACLFSDAAFAVELDLIGTWHVLVHYRDDATAAPDALRWDDRIWVFRKRGDRLEWLEYPIVVFEEPTGRFENLGTNRASRVRHAWVPDDHQRREIESGLAVNPRGSKKKSLRRAGPGAWRSVGSLRATSVNVVGYHELWTIEGMPGSPVFERADSMGSGASATVEGRTTYESEQVSDDGARIEGRYERDGTRHGRFTLTRAGPVKNVGTKETNADRVQKHLLGGIPGADTEESEPSPR